MKQTNSAHTGNPKRRDMIEKLPEAVVDAKQRTDEIRTLSNYRANKGVLCSAKKKKGGGDEARGLSTAGAPQNCEGRVEADFVIMLSRITKFAFFSNVAPKIEEKAENAQKKKRVTGSRLVYRDDAEGEGASRCRRRENTSRRQAKKLQPLRKPLSASVCYNEDESGRLKPDL